ncbi:unnamed protein product [Prunus armeniaca]
MSSSNSDGDNTDSLSDDSDDEFYDLISVGCVMVVSEWLKYVDKEPCRTSSHTGYKWVIEVLNGHEVRCHEQFRMEKHVFKKLLETLTSTYGLKEGGEIPLLEALAMFLITLGHGFTNRMVQERFQHSGETVSRWFGIILEAISRMATDLISPSDPEFKRVPKKIKDDNRYWPYFKDCIGAIDGTHVPVVVPRERQVPYIGRKGITTQNIMVVCDFNMCFTFAWAGWEGATHDARIFMEALRIPTLKFPHPPTGKYYLVDSGYPQMKGYLGPYRGERYHLPDFRRGSQPRGKKEIFNHRHSSLRCTIERTFGVWKNRWRMIRQIHNFPLEKQVQVVIASMALHNFIRIHSMMDVEFQPYDDDEELLPQTDDGRTSMEETIVQENVTRAREMDDERETIANLLMSI